MSTTARSSTLPSSIHWQLPVGFIATTHLLIPVLLLSTAPAVLRSPRGWLGATLFAAQLFCLLYTSTVLALRIAPLARIETGIVALTIFLSFPSVIVSYLGLAGFLSFTNLLIAMGGLQIVLLTTWRQTPGSTPARPTASEARITFGEGFLILLSLLAFGIMAFNSVRYTSADSDTMWYHLPLVAEMIKNHSIVPVKSIPLIARAYPGAREAILAWLSFPMTSDNLALLFLIELPGVFFCMYGICREFDVPPTASLSVATLFVSTPEISMWATSQKNDLFLTLTFLLVFYFLLRWVRMGSVRYAALAGLAAGTLCSAKIAGPVYGVALGATLGVALLLGKGGDSPGKSTTDIIWAVSLMLGVASIAGTPWYIRNLIYFHNPFYPKEITVLGKTVFAGPLDVRFFLPITIGFHFFRLLSYWKQFVDELGVALPALVAVPLLLLVMFYRRRSGRPKDRDFVAWLVLLPLMLVSIYLIQPYSLLPVGVNVWQVQPRFLLCFLACLNIGLGFLLSADPRYMQLGVPIVVLATIVNLAHWSHYWWIVITLAALMAIMSPFLLGASVRLFANTRSIKKALTAIAAVTFVICVAGSYWLDGFRERRKDDAEYGYSDISPGWARICLYVRHNIANERLLYLGRPENFPLYGPGYSNKLYAADGDVVQLIQNEHIKYVIGFRPFERHGSRGEEWVYGSAPTEQLIERRPDKFQLVYSFDGSQIVRVLE
jgi:hypothetical protein